MGVLETMAQQISLYTGIKKKLTEEGRSEPAAEQIVILFIGRALR